MIETLPDKSLDAGCDKYERELRHSVALRAFALILFKIAYEARVISFQPRGQFMALQERMLLSKYLCYKI